MELKEEKDRRDDQKSELHAILDGQQLEEKEEMTEPAEKADAIKKMDMTEPEIPSKDDSQEAERLLQQQQVAFTTYEMVFCCKWICIN
jgi:hypothetical protein